MLIKILNTKLFQAIIEAILLTLSVTLIIAPIIIIKFNTINITNFFSVIIASFLIGPIMILGLSIILLKIKILQQLLSILLEILINCAKLGAKLPFNQIYFVTPNFFQIIIYYSLIFLIYFFTKINLEKRKSSFQMRIKNLLNLAKYKIYTNKNRVFLIIIINVLIITFYFFIPKDLRIYFVDVGQRRLYINCNTNK